MAFLGSRSCHEPCALRIQDYLELRDSVSRAIAHDFVNIYGEHDQNRWAQRMDITRESEGNDKAYAGKRAVTYRHFVISPDPRDHVDLETLRNLTMDWVNEFFGTDLEPGMLGSYEVAVVYHDDNTHHVPHAHIIVNNTDLNTGKRLQINNKCSRSLMPDTLQEIAQKYGLRYFDNSTEAKAVQKSATRGAFITKAERALDKAGIYSWKRDLRDRVKTALVSTNTREQFFDELDFLQVDAHMQTTYSLRHPSMFTGDRPVVKERLKEALTKIASIVNITGDGAIVKANTNTPEETEEKLREMNFDVEAINRDWVYQLKDNPRAKCRGYRLGRNYTYDAYLKTRNSALNNKTFMQNDEQIRANINRFIAESRVVGFAEENQSIHDIAKTLTFNRKYRIRSLEDYETRERKILRALKTSELSELKSELKDKLVRELRTLEAARSIAKDSELFIGTVPEKRSGASSEENTEAKPRTRRWHGGGLYASDKQKQRSEERAQSAQKRRDQQSRGHNI